MGHRYHMKRLDSFIRRIRAQRACLNMVRCLLVGIPGSVLFLSAERTLFGGMSLDNLDEFKARRMIADIQR